MSTTEIEVRQPRPQANAAALPAKVEYARELANSGLLPAAYRRNPGNILYAVEFGEMLGLAPMAAITGVHVIEGKPTASAGLISALVRRAGHKLRLKGDSKSATCQIVRADDPDFTFEVTWTLKRDSSDNPSAEAAGLLGKGVWKNYPASMLKSRAITQCARDACEEALFGLHYTPEELGAEVDEDGAVLNGAQPAPAKLADRSGGTPQDDPFYVRPAPEDPWLAGALKAAPNHATLEACGAVWRKSAEMVRAGELPKEQAEELQRLLYNRMTELKAAAKSEPEVIEGEIVEHGAASLDPEDPWLTAIGDAVDAGEAGRILDDARDQAARTELDPARLALIEQAIEEAFPGLTTTEAQAA